MTVERVVGIDFGTSSSVIKVKTFGNDEPMGEIVGADYIRFDNRDFVPTLVYTARDGSMLYGYEAANASVPGDLSHNFKLDLISGDEETRAGALHFTKQFYNYLFKAYSEQSPRLPACDIETTIISYPAKWPQSLRDDMIAIAQGAGFKNVTGIDEPSAAVKAVMVHDNKSVRLNDDGAANILVVDMGAGTTDLVFCRFEPKSSRGTPDVSILNIWPKGDKGSLLGGREVDEALCEYVKRYLVNCGLPGSRDFRDRYIDKCKAWKETNVSPVLAKPDGVVRYCGFAESIMAMLGTDAEFPPLSRIEFENMLEAYLAQLPQMVNGCLEDAGASGADVDCVILTGGHSQWYFAEEILTGKITKFGRVNLDKIAADQNRIVRTPNPQETVALGLAYQKLIPKPLHTGPIEENVVYCTFCGTRNVDTDIYCKRCERNLSEPQYQSPIFTHAVPQAVANSGKTEIFALPFDKTIKGIADTVQSLLNSKNMSVQVIDSKDGGFIVQARDKDGKWKQFIGMDVALNVVIKKTGATETATYASLEFKQAKWVDKGGIMALSLFVFWPLTITAGIGMYMQGKLPGEIKNTVAVYVNS